MAAEIECDGCGNTAAMHFANGHWHKPDLWFQRSDDDGVQTACSLDCISKIAEKTGKRAHIAGLIHSRALTQ